MKEIIEVSQLGNIPSPILSEKDSEGYYHICVGALNAFNTRGEYYVADKAMEKIKRGSKLAERAERGELRSEYGHPKWEAGWSDTQYIERLKYYDEDRICANLYGIGIVENYRDTTKIGNGVAPVYPITAKVRPSGPLSSELRKDFEDPHMNVSFSIRSIVNMGLHKGVYHKLITNALTFDVVASGGITIANQRETKLNRIANESAGGFHQLPYHCEGGKCTPPTPELNLTPVFSLESFTETVDRTVNYLEKTTPKRSRPIYYKW